MKRRTSREIAHLILGLVAFLAGQTAVAQTDRASNTIILDETGVKNLRIETVLVEEADFEETVFALGRIEAIPGKIAAVSSRIAGRIVALNVSPGDTVEEGDEVAKVESRLPGDPPPIISLSAPLSGLVTRLDGRLGAPLEPENALMEITDLSEVYAVARVPEHQAGQMNPGAKAHIVVAALPNEEFEGELLRFGTSADKESGTIDAIFRLPNSNGLIRADMRAEFSIVISKRSNVMSIPRSALQGEASNRFVYVKDFDLPNAFVSTSVQIGQMNDRYVEILSGLFPSDDVVTRGAYSLSFAGASSVSLKEALDAAHGHEHAADGSELTPEMKAAAGGEEPGHGNGGVNPLWRTGAIVLFVLLILSSFIRKGPEREAGEDDADLNPSEKEAA